MYANVEIGHEDFSFIQYCEYVKCAEKLRLGDKVQIYVLEDRGCDYYYQSKKTDKLSPVFDIVGLDGQLVLFGCKTQCGELYDAARLGSRRSGIYIDNISDYFVWWGSRTNSISGRIAKLIRE